MWVADILGFVSVDGPPNVYIDGMRISGTASVDFGGAVPAATAVDIDEWVNINDIVGIEVYRSRILAPLRFSMFGSGGGVILIWTNRGG
jgi:hypothetical protein